MCKLFKYFFAVIFCSLHGMVREDGISADSVTEQSQVPQDEVYQDETKPEKKEYSRAEAFFMPPAKYSKRMMAPTGVLPENAAWENPKDALCSGTIGVLSMPNLPYEHTAFIHAHEYPGYAIIAVDQIKGTAQKTLHRFPELEYRLLLAGHLVKGIRVRSIDNNPNLLKPVTLDIEFGKTRQIITTDLPSTMDASLLWNRLVQVVRRSTETCPTQVIFDIGDPLATLDLLNEAYNKTIKIPDRITVRDGDKPVQVDLYKGLGGHKIGQYSFLPVQGLSALIRELGLQKYSQIPNARMIIGDNSFPINILEGTKTMFTDGTWVHKKVILTDGTSISLCIDA